MSVSKPPSDPDHVRREPRVCLTAEPSARRRLQERKQKEADRIHYTTPEVCPCFICDMKRMNQRCTHLEEENARMRKAFTILKEKITFILRPSGETGSGPGDYPVGLSADSSPVVDWQEPTAHENKNPL